ncbi:hypothetical protein GCM10012288_06270 [Malaciobacter pacificus]|jgi:hypothetical protein|uniref:Putative membrane protein n=1 Tax=Malaciobacter pacificus TaxID=1080223 RepID=A0A5C2H8Q6_9BACT|nr:hypothetical protein [Malaciobacter pacificus]QEP33845.1 putative membrane protein [Malaciobacter pacificus]GGD35037.1 hypothetical protein GCM10012288_06270 [Malaciobacter pacificus]
MQILIFSLLIIALIIYLVYKIKTSFTKKELVTTSVVAVSIVVAILFFSVEKKNQLPNAFKQYYKEHKGLEVLKLSFNQTNVEVLSSSKNIYKFNYLIQKEGQEYFCEAKDVEVIKVEDEYIFKDFKEECRVR